MLAALANWFTPTALFCLLNLMIATIFLTHKPHKPGPDPAHPLARAPSLLDRARSINFNLYNSDPTEDPTPSLLERVRSINFNTLHITDPTQEPDQTHHLPRAPSLLERVRSFNFSPSTTEQPEPETRTESPTRLTRTPSMLERVWSNHSPLRRSESDETDTRRPDPSFSVANAVGSGKMKKSVSEKMKEKKAEDDSPELRRPATVRVKNVAALREDEAVDEKADDFINKFRQHLKLQRMDSILRFKEMLNRGA